MTTTINNKYCIFEIFEKKRFYLKISSNPIWGAFLGDTQDFCVRNISSIIDENIQKLINMGYDKVYTRQYRDYASDCQVKETTLEYALRIVYDGGSRMSGHHNIILANENGNYIEFNLDSDFLHKSHCDIREAIFKIAKVGIAEYINKSFIDKY